MAQTKDKNTTCEGMSVEDIVDHGTPTQKAYKVLMDYQDYKSSHREAPITQSDVDRILESMDMRDRRFYRIYRVYNRTYGEIIVRFTSLKENFEKHCETLKGMYISLVVEEKLLTEVYNNLSPESREKVLHSPSTTLEVVDLGDGVRAYFRKQSKDWEGTVHDVQLRAYMALGAVVQYVNALDKFDKEYKKEFSGLTLGELRLFKPRMFLELLKDVKSDKICKDIPEISRKVLHEKMARGEYVSDWEKDRALIPYYDEIKVIDSEVDWWYRYAVRTIYSIIKKAF